MTDLNVQPVLLCGGSGTRLWPLSTGLQPKQFLALTGSRSMLEATFDRFKDYPGYDAPIFVGSKRHEALLKKSNPEARLILEPFGRNSAPAIAAAALSAPQSSLQIALPADHHIKDVKAFHTAIDQARDIANQGKIVTFGISPDHPATGYGYIEALEHEGRVRNVKQFVEKPDKITAQTYLETGRYFWNAGIFLYRTDIMLQALDRYAPDIVKAVKAALPVHSRIMVLNSAEFANCPSDSIDYAVMEHADNIAVIPVDMGWSDLGDHKAIYDLARDEQRSATAGPVALTDSSGCFVQSMGPQIAVHGVENLTVLATETGVLVTPTHRAAEIKPAVETLLSGKAHTQQVSADRLEALKQWLVGDILPHWLDRAWDNSASGYIESLDMAGNSEPERERRGRVAPRQIFSLARIAQRCDIHADKAQDMSLKGLSYLDTQARSPQGGWAHRLNIDGSVLDARRDFYDHTFIALAGSEAYAATGDRLAQSICEEAFDLIDTLFDDPDGPGWRDCETHPSDRRASNPHMHLLEASINAYRVFGAEKDRYRAEKIANLYESRLFQYEYNAVLEDFDPHWAPLAENGQFRVEPGHCYEWAYLLMELESLTGRDTRSWRSRLINFADNYGCAQTGLVYNAVNLKREPIDSNHRLWPQLERFRAKLTHPAHIRPAELDRLVDQMFEVYFNQGPKGGWVDCVSSQGQSLSEHIPASMLYHLVTAFDWVFEL